MNSTLGSVVPLAMFHNGSQKWYFQSSQTVTVIRPPIKVRTLPCLARHSVGPSCEFCSNCWICQSCYMDFSKLLDGFVKIDT